MFLNLTVIAQGSQNNKPPSSTRKKALKNHLLMRQHFTIFVYPNCPKFIIIVIKVIIVNFI